MQWKALSSNFALSTTFIGLQTYFSSCGKFLISTTTTINLVKFAQKCPQLKLIKDGDIFFKLKVWYMIEFCMCGWLFGFVVINDAGLRDTF